MCVHLKKADGNLTVSSVRHYNGKCLTGLKQIIYFREYVLSLLPKKGFNK